LNSIAKAPAATKLAIALKFIFPHPAFGLDDLQWISRGISTRDSSVSGYNAIGATRALSSSALSSWSLDVLAGVAGVWAFAATGTKIIRAKTNAAIRLALFEGETARNLRRCAGASEKRPPQSIYVMLFGLGLGALLAGHRKFRSFSD
jgi:hypothetical protein